MRIGSLMGMAVSLLLLTSCAATNVERNGARHEQGREDSYRGGRHWPDLVTDISSEIFLGAQKGVIFYAYDVLAYPQKPIELAARVQLARRLEDVPGVRVGFYLGSKLIGTDRTDKSGRAVVSWSPPKIGDFLLTAKINAVPDKDYKDMLEVSPAPLLVAAREKDAEFVVIDLDHTVVASSFFRVLIGPARPMPGAVKVTREIAKKYSIIYLTQRPNLLTVKSKQWLSEESFPAGPVLLSDLGQALRGSGKFKTSQLALSRKNFPNIKIGIGDKPSDAQAYVDNGMTAYLLPNYKEKTKDMRNLAEKIHRLRGPGRLQVVMNWEQIGQGIFQSKKFPPQNFLSYLERRADQLEQEEKLRQKEDDDD